MDRVTVIPDWRRPSDAAELVLAAASVNVVGDEEIEVAVSIDVEKRAAGAPQISMAPPAFGTSVKRPRPAFGWRFDPTLVTYRSIDPVVVVVAGARSHPIVAMPDARCARHIIECSVATSSI